MSPLKRRRRLPQPTTSLSNAVLSVFATAAQAEPHHHEHHGRSPANPIGEPTPMLRHSPLASLCERLVCLSRHGADAPLAALTAELRTRACGASELAALLFDDDDADAAPPLCVVVNLLRAHSLHVADVQQTYVVNRAMFEIDHPELCQCSGVHGGVHAMLHYLLDGRRGSRSDAVLRHLVAVFFGPSAHIHVPVGGATRFQLATLVVRMLHDECTKFGERVATVSQWVQQAVAPSHYLERPVRDGAHVIWTPELSGLATHRGVHEYFTAGKCEEEALMALFRAIPATDASEIYLTSIGELLKSSESDDVRKEPVTGTWSRLVLLGNRVTDREAFQDVNEDLRRSIVSSITGTLCSPACLRDACSVAVMLCLARRILIPFREVSPKEGTTSHAIERYQVWFRDIVVRNDASVLRGLLDPLTQLVPLESLHFLKLNHRVFSAHPTQFRISSEYTVLARARIRDFDPQFGRATSAQAKPSSSDGKPSSKELTDFISLVSEFIKLDRVLPGVLIRQMNFHRYHFRRVTMPLLLRPSLMDLQPVEGDLDLGTDPDVFDNYRIEMIEVLAFKRKDHAISSSEGKKAIKAIKAARQTRSEQRKNTKIEKRKGTLASAEVGLSSSVHDIVVAVLRDESEHGLNATQLCQDGRQVQKAKELLVTNIGDSISRCNSETERANIATDVLQNITSAIETVEQERHADDIVNAQPATWMDGEKMLQQYSEWWGRTGRSLLWLLSKVLANERLLQIQKHVRYQLFVLICARIDSLSEYALLSLAMFLSVLVALEANSALCDLSFVPVKSSSSRLRHIAKVIFDCLPLSTPDMIVASTIFSIHCVSLLSTYTGSVLMAADCDQADVDVMTLTCLDQKSGIDDFTKPLWVFLQWIVSNQWRLDVTKESSGASKGAVFTTYANDAYRKAVVVLQVTPPDCSQAALVDSLLELEVRCGWGCKQAIVALLHGFRTSGLHSMLIVHAVAAFLACVGIKSERKTNWILQGLLLFHDEVSVGMEIENSIDSNAANNVHRCIARDGATAAFKLLELYCSMDFDYFVGCTDVDGHIERVLVRHMWPLPNRITSYLLRCLSHHDKEFISISNPFFVANCALVHENFTRGGRRIPRIENGKHGKKRTGLYKNSAEIASAVRAVVFTGRGIDSDDGDNETIMYSQVDARNVIGTASFQNAHAFGVTLAMYFAHGYDTGVEEVVKNAASKLRAKCGNVASSDVLDGAMFASAFLAISRVGHVSDEVMGVQYDTERVDLVLQTFVYERIGVCDGVGQCVPFWVSEDLKDGGLNQTDGLGLLLRAWSECDDLNDQVGESKAGLVLARVLATVDGMEDSLLQRFLEKFGPNLDGACKQLLSNLVWGYAEIAKVGERWGSESRTALITAIWKVSLHLQGRADGDLVEGMTNRYGRAGVEIIGLLKGRGLR